MKVAEFESIQIRLASPEEILNWSHGEVSKAETINYRTQKPEKDGLFCERIFGPTKDFQCYCGKYKGIRYKDVVCDRCGVEITNSFVRRERMGHISLACPVSHIWFLKGTPSKMGQVLNVSRYRLERVIYFADYIITEVDEKAKKKALKGTKDSEEKKELAEIRPLKILSELEHRQLSLKYGDVFEAGTGAETLRKIFEKIDLDKEMKKLEKELEKASTAQKTKLLERLRLFRMMKQAKIRPEWMFLTVLPILPPDLRPMVQLDGGRFASSDLNDLYRRVINRNNRLKYLSEIAAPEVIIRNEKRMLQEAVDALFDNEMRKGTTTAATTGGQRLLKSLASILKGKRGRFRRNLLGKRVDYSGRSVIVVGPELKLDQVGLPKIMALELFRPFVIKKILERELAYNVRGASRLIDEQTNEVWAILEEVVKDKLVLLNRAPTLHRLSIQAFRPVLIEGEAIRIHPMICRVYGADFDGDQMAVHVPLSSEAQKEARDLMFSLQNLLIPATGKPGLHLTQDIALGIYWMTETKEGAKGEGKIFSGPEEAILAQEFGDVDLRAKIKLINARLKTRSTQDNLRKSALNLRESAFLETTVGRIIFNQALPKDFPFINKKLAKQGLLKVVAQLIEDYKGETVWLTLDRIKALGFEYSTRAGISWGMDDLIIPQEKKRIIEKAEKEEEKINSHYKKGLLSEEERKNKVIEIWHRAKSEIEILVPKTLPQLGSVFTIIDAGARGSWSQPVQMAGMKGLVVNPAGQVMDLPVKSSYKEGFNILEYFISTHGARKGTADTALRTSSAGYLTRRLIDVAHGLVISQEDCGDKQGIEIFLEDAKEMGQDLGLKIGGRIAAENISVGIRYRQGKKTIVKKGEIIDWDKAKQIAKLGIEKVRVRSPLSCQSAKGICQKCYGWDLGSNKMIGIGGAVGIVAAQAIGEPGTQLTLRTFHIGGVAGGADITSGLPRVEEVFEARPPKGQAVISKTKGQVSLVDEKKGMVKIKVEKKGEKGKPAQNKVLRRARQNVKLLAGKSENIEYKIPAGRTILVQPGQKIEPGQALCEGSKNLKELFRVADKETTERYIINEIQDIYVSQGAVIHDKHLEVMVRQMFSRLRVKKPGDSWFLPGEVIEREKFLEENEVLKKTRKKKIEASPVLLGISNVALSTDSFLSAASFQNTSRVLIEAAIEGKEDKLKGLKENVIIGKLIPVGTGFRK